MSLRTAAGRASAAGPGEIAPAAACPPGLSVVKDLPSPRQRNPALARRKATAVRPPGPGRFRLGRSSLAGSSGSESVLAPAAGLIRFCSDSRERGNTTHIPLHLRQTVFFDTHFLGRTAAMRTLGRFLGRTARLLDLSGAHEDARSLATLARFLARTAPMRTLGRSVRLNSKSSRPVAQ